MTNVKELNKLKVPELKTLLTSKSLPITGNKPDLIARLLENEGDESETSKLEEENGIETEAAPTAAKDDDNRVPKDDSSRPTKRPRLDEVETALPAETTADAPVAPGPPVSVVEETPVAVSEIPAARDDVPPPPSEQTAPQSSAPSDAPLPPPPPPAFESAPELPSETALLAPARTAAASEPEAESSDEEEEVYVPDANDQKARTDLYLDTVNRHLLDFDFEKLCSVSLSNNNVYCCLVDGKYFQGRGKGSWAYKHSVNTDRHVWLKLETEEFYILPDGYKVSDPSLNDILRVLNPRYTVPQIQQLSHLPSPSYNLNNQPYLPGYIGLNNIKANDYLNVIIHSLLHVPPLRDFLLSPETKQLQPEAKPTELVKRFSELAKKVWSPHLFKAQVSPHEFLQEVNLVSGGKFKITEQGDPIEFMSWLLNRLHKDLGGSKKPKSSIIYETFQGELRMETQQIVIKADSGGNRRPEFDISRDTKTMRSPFLFLALDLPKPPLFQDSVEKNIIPQVALSTILAKYDGATTHEFGDTMKRHQLLRLPPYLILHTKRFTKNNFVEEKNPTIVNFPLRGVDMAPYVDAPASSAPHSSLYDLIANIPFESSIASTTTKTGSKTATNPAKKQKIDEGDMAKWKVHLRAGGGGGDAEKWFSVENLRVEEVQREMVFLGETVIQIWQRRDLGPA